jgi:hypothetical protein
MALIGATAIIPTFHLHDDALTYASSINDPFQLLHQANFLLAQRFAFAQSILTLVKLPL